MVLPESLEFRVMMIGVATINFFICFILEVNLYGWIILVGVVRGGGGGPTFGQFKKII